MNFYSQIEKYHNYIKNNDISELKDLFQDIKMNGNYTSFDYDFPNFKAYRYAYRNLKFEFINESDGVLDVNDFLYQEISWANNFKWIGDLEISEINVPNHEIRKFLELKNKEFRNAAIEISNYLTRIQEKPNSKLDQPIVESPEEEESNTYKLKLLEKLGILDFFMERYGVANKGNFGKVIAKIIGAKNPGSISSMVQDFYNDIDVKKANRKDFRRSNKDYEDIKEFINTHLKK